ncbi:MAG: hypothetical protein P4L84_16395 [Isosphaeraceae bacterium]|nr:hypothetical protein [Isosphaeraceae bacterium]
MVASTWAAACLRVGLRSIAIRSKSASPGVVVATAGAAAGRGAIGMDADSGNAGGDEGRIDGSAGGLWADGLCDG